MIVIVEYAVPVHVSVDTDSGEIQWVVSDNEHLDTTGKFYDGELNEILDRRPVASELNKAKDIAAEQDWPAWGQGY